MDDREYRILLRWWGVGWRRVIDSEACNFDGGYVRRMSKQGKGCESNDQTMRGGRFERGRNMSDPDPSNVSRFDRCDRWREEQVNNGEGV